MSMLPRSSVVNVATGRSSTTTVKVVAAELDDVHLQLRTTISTAGGGHLELDFADDPSAAAVHQRGVFFGIAEGIDTGAELARQDGHARVVANLNNLRLGDISELYHWHVRRGAGTTTPNASPQPSGVRR